MGGAPLTAEPSRASGNLGRLAFGFLLVATATGVALVPLYTPAQPFQSLETIQAGVPWGFFLRALHAYSSFGLLVTTAGHLAQVLLRRTEAQLSFGVWWRSVALLPITLLALLGGFLLRGDADAVAAGEVYRRIVEAFPIAGPELSVFLLGGSPGELGAVLAHHTGTFTLILWLLTAEHGARLWPDVRSGALAALASLAIAGSVPLPLGTAPSLVLPGGLLLGPWYLLGLQGALVDLPPAIGWLAPALIVLLLGLFRHAPGRWRAALLALTGVWIAAYAAFTVRLLLMHR